MSLIAALADIKPDQIKRRAAQLGTPTVTNIKFFRATLDAPETPSAYLVKYDPGRFSQAHYHTADQFQIIVEGKGRFARHDVAPYCVHFARAYTPYGPLRASEETGWTFLTLRTHYDAGAQRPIERLKQIPNRAPLQLMKPVAFTEQSACISVQDDPDIQDDQGLLVRSLTMAPGAQTLAPNPAHGDGQFIVVLSGSLMYANREHKSLAVVFVRPEEPAFRIHAGAQGVQALILNFPAVESHAVRAL